VEAAVAPGPAGTLGGGRGEGGRRGRSVEAAVAPGPAGTLGGGGGAGGGGCARVRPAEWLGDGPY